MIRATRLLTGSFLAILPSKISVWNLTRKCNLSCKHCYIDAGENKGDELSKEEAFYVIDELASLDFKVLLFSGGEPLLYNYLFELNTYAKNKGIKTCLSSNGSLITEEIAIKIKDGGFEYVGISIDGIKETHDRFRGISGSFDKALQGLRILKKQGVKRGIRFTLTKENIDELPNVIGFAENEGIERFCLYHLIYTGRGKEGMDVGKEERIKAIEYLIKRIEKGIKMEILTVANPCDGIYLLKKKPEIKIDNGCQAGERIINISPEGNIYPCQFFKKSLGNIREKSLKEILKNPFLGKLKNRENLKGRCGKCVYKETCGGCRVRAYATTSDYFGEDLSCYV
ncbi:MAG: radical SAM protein [bacterium]